MRYFLLMFCLLLLSPINHALSLKENAPSQYVVKPGDTLWGIANLYLKNPWEWKALWHANPSISNPSRLYPGAVIHLAYRRNKPYLKVISNGMIKLSPSMRSSAGENAVPTVPLAEIKPFLDESLILDDNILKRSPYIVAMIGDRVLGSQGDEAYVRGLHTSSKLPLGGTISYSIFRSGKDYTDPITHELLGYKADLVGYAELIAGGEPATIILTGINQGIKLDDKVLINNSPEFELYFEPATPTTSIHGMIIEIPDRMPIGNFQTAIGGVVVLNKGADSGLKVGDVLAIFGKDRLVNDPQKPVELIKLPPERVGEAMVFRTFTKTSFALVVRSTHAIYLLDSVGNP